MSETIQEEKKKCTKCKHTLVLSEFKQNRSGIYTKSCKRCLGIAKKNRDKRKFDEANHIDLKFVREILTEQKHCHYCDTEVQYVNFESDLATIERIDNDMGHIKGNCVIACRECGGSSICEHNRQLQHCRECSGNPLEKSVINWQS